MPEIIGFTLGYLALVTAVCLYILTPRKAPMSTFTIEYRPETRNAGGPYEVMQESGHCTLRQTPEEAYAFVLNNSDANAPTVRWINVPAHLQPCPVCGGFREGNTCCPPLPRLERDPRHPIDDAGPAMS